MVEGTFRSYTTGYIMSLVLTFAAFLITIAKTASIEVLVVSLIGLAIVQMLVQLHFFIHLIKESQPRWSLLVFLFMTMIVVILVAGTLWIMYNLNYNMMVK